MRVRGGVVGGHDQHAAAAPGADPVLGERDRLRGARAGGVDLRVRPPRPDQLGELRVAHREDAEEEPAVEGVRLLLERALEVVNAPLDLVEHHRIGAVVVEHPRPQRLERGEALAAHVIRGVARDLVGHLLEAGERRGVDHPGVVAQLVRERPAVGKLGALGRGLVAQHERDARRREARRCPRRSPAGCRARARPAARRRRRTPRPGRTRRHAPASLITASRRSIVSNEAPPSSPLTSRVMCLSSMSRRRRPGMTSIPCSPLSSRRDVRVVEQPLGAGKPERRAGDRPPAHAPAPRRRRPPARAREPSGARRSSGARRARASRTAPRMRLRGRAWPELDRLARDRVPAGPEARGPQAAQGVVERRHVALLGVVAGEADDRVVAEHVGGEALKRVLRADLDEDPRALVVQGVQALDELHGRGDLAARACRASAPRRRRRSDRARR